MQYTDDRYHLRVEINPKQCNIPEDELVRMQQLLQPLGEAVQWFPTADLRINLIRHPRSDAYNVECRLKLPGKTVSTADGDVYLDSAFQRCLRKLIQKVQQYREQPNQDAEARAVRETALARDIVAPAEPTGGVLGKAACDGNYKAFRTAAAAYEEWLRLRIGRWVQRYPDAEARIGRGLAIGDILEEVYLNAFERYLQRPTDLALHDWLESLIDPSLKALLHDPDGERENVSLARTLRETPL